MATTLHNLFVHALEARGCRIVPARTGKYTVLSNAMRPDTQTFFFVGFGGALRVGECATRSIPVCDKVKLALLEEAKVVGL